MRYLIVIAFTVFALTGCNLAPTYKQPFMPIPEHFKETGKWVAIKTMAPQGQPSLWWQLFNDPTLNELQARVIPANQNLKAAFARYQQACALVQVAQSGLFPTINGLINTARNQSSTNIANPSTTPLYNNVTIGASLNYELDVWGRIRNSIEQNADLAKASAADLAAATLSIHATLASTYFSLRGADEAQRVLDNTVIAYTKALDITTRRYKGGVSPISDVYEADTQLENSKTLAADMRLQRSQLEHAIAVLIGVFPEDFTLVAAKLPKDFVTISPDLPSTLLERRPDIAASMLRVAAANANIGIARAAFFPVFNLSGIIGFQSKSLSNLFSKPSLFWSLGPATALSLIQPTASMILFDGGKLLGLLKQVNASYFETVANYRQLILTAFQEVEDNLVAIRQLEQEKRTSAAAARSAKNALIQAKNRYKGGIITFLDVVVVENIALQAELSEINIRTRRHTASVQLFKALGGGFAQNRLPSKTHETKNT